MEDISSETINILRSLVAIFGIEPSKLDEMESYPLDKKRAWIVKTGFEIEANPTLDKLTQALQNSSVMENRAAEKTCRGISFEGASSVPESSLSPCDQTTPASSKLENLFLGY